MRRAERFAQLLRRSLCISTFFHFFFAKIMRNRLLLVMRYGIIEAYQPRKESRNEHHSEPHQRHKSRLSRA
jgi:hypothetical protein